MEEIRYIRLHNGGGFVAQMVVHYEEVSDGNIINKSYEESGHHDVTLGFARTIDLSSAGIPEGATVFLSVKVVWGTENQSPQKYTYKSTSNRMARFVITGTTLNNHMGDEGTCDH